MVNFEKDEVHEWHGERLSVRVGGAGAPTFVWLGGLRSDMDGTKANLMVQHAASLGASSLRFDYSGHGKSSGAFADFCLSDWLAQSIEIFEKYIHTPAVLVGSSMGGWLALRMVQELGDKIAGLILLAPAPDFTRELMRPAFSPSQLDELQTHGFISIPSEYSTEPMIITKKFLDDGDKHLVLNSPLHLNAPVRILQGMQDPDVPYTHALRLLENLLHDNVTFTLIKNGDHRLSTPSNLELLRRTMSEMHDAIR